MSDGNTAPAPRVNQPAPGAASGFGRQFWVVLMVIQARLRFIVLLAGIGFVALSWKQIEAWWDKVTRPRTAQSAAAADAEFYCPMHPQVVRDHPDNCPICGMPLSKRQKGVGAEEPLPAGVISRVQLTPYRVALAGIRTAEVGYRPLAREIETVGFVEFDEQKLARITSRITGRSRIDKLYANVTGQMVHKGDDLALLYNADAAVAVQNLLDARPGDRELVRQKLRLWGIDDDQVRDIERAGRPVTHVHIRSPITGHVIRKYQVEGEYVEEGGRLYDVADLSAVWVQAQVYEDELGFLKEGQPVQATTPAFPGRTFAGRIAFIHPHMDRATRTLTVRFDMDNPKHELRPGMYATVRIETALAAAGGPAARPDGQVLAVPETAVIDTGSRKVVYREASPGVYEGVEVRLGARAGGFYPVLRGLKAGERVATNGSFLIDAETRLNPAAGATYFGAAGGPHAERRDATAAPDQEAKVKAALAKLGPEDRKLAEVQKLCPIQQQDRLGAMGPPHKIMLKGKPVFLCCKACEEEARAHPDETLAAVERLKAKTGSAENR
jgi:Cu(I)/Ag(I) efflux system membrane fusion protein